MIEVVGSIVEQVVSPHQFQARSPLVPRLQRVPAETIRWELFQGHLLDPAATRQTRQFAAWHVFLDEAAAEAKVPLISVRWHAESGQLFVTRQILTHAHEAYEESPGVIGTRPTQKWVSELVGTLVVNGEGPDDTANSLANLVYLAVVGSSRLPITSLESPLPDFSLGRFSYWPLRVRDGLDPVDQVLTHGDDSLKARAIEFRLRMRVSHDVVDEALRKQLETLGPVQTERLLRVVFNQSSLSPYTEFASRLVRLVECLGDEPWFGDKRALELLSYMLRYLGRHLTAFDLTLFHSFGANYPDGLFLDELLKALLRLVTRDPSAGHASKMVRRALRQAALLRRHYEGLRVPDAPTSMGENARVLPAPFTRVPEEQILEQGKRRRTLFSDDPTDALVNEFADSVFRESINDLDQDPELRELGMAIFLDRPLGILKQPGEVDRTPLVSYEAFSRMVAIRRLAIAKSAGWITQQQHEHLRSRVGEVAPVGFPVAELEFVERPGVVSLGDANKAAADFIVVRSTRSSLDPLLAQYDWSPLVAHNAELATWLLEDPHALLVPHRGDRQGARPSLRFFDRNNLRLEVGPHRSASTMATYRERAGSEVLSPLIVVQVRNAAGEMQDVSSDRIMIHARTT